MTALLKTFLLSILAGISISLGASFSLIVSNIYCSSIVFSLGIILVMVFQFRLFTGVVPQVFQNKTSFEDLTIIYFGNIIGTVFFSELIKSSSKYFQIYEKARSIILLKTDPLKCLISAIGCGIIIGLIVNIKEKTFKYILSIPLIMIFILLGFDHCIATSFYMFSCGQIDGIILLAITIGNIIGGLFVSIGMFCYTKTNT